MGLRAGQYGISFQSRLGGGWLEPFTDVELAELPARGLKRIVAVSPSFVADCLETMEEMALRGQDTFMAAGGESYTYVPVPQRRSALDRSAGAAVSAIRGGHGMSRIIVVGAGIAGLTIAYRMSAAHQVLVFERQALPGGKIHSQTIDGYTFEWGPNGFFSNATELRALVSGARTRRRPDRGEPGRLKPLYLLERRAAQTPDQAARSA